METKLFSKDDKKADISNRVEIGKWCVVEQPESHNIMGVNTPFWGRYQARKVVGIEDGKVSKTAIIIFDTNEQEGKLLKDYEAAHTVLEVNLSEAGAKRIASALSGLDIHIKAVKRQVLDTRGEAPHPLFEQVGEQGVDSYRLIENR